MGTLWGAATLTTNYLDPPVVGKGGELFYVGAATLTTIIATVLKAKSGTRGRKKTKEGKFKVV